MRVAEEKIPRNYLTDGVDLMLKNSMANPFSGLQTSPASPVQLT